MKTLHLILALAVPMLGQSLKQDQLRAVASIEKAAAENYQAICEILDELGSRRTAKFQMGCREMVSDLKDQATRSDEFSFSQADPALIVTRIKAEADYLTDAATKAYAYCGAAVQISRKLNRNDRPLDCEKLKDADARAHESIRRYFEEP
jgi:hypothetical protein